ncbi:MAG: aminotransferase class V-fold PLP-dependent enzyme [Candidatus Hodarchaeales archaeon]|jgi:selenocysteine lyase/cysteine desulfurase
MISNDILNDFPARKKYHYFSTASIGLVPNPVIESLKEYLFILSQGGTSSFDEEMEVLVYDNLRKQGSKLLQCSFEDVAVFNSVSEAMNIIAWSLGLESGKIVSTVIEHPTVTYPWLRIADKKDLSVELVETTDWCIDLDDFLEKIDSQTKAVVLSHVEYLSGQKFDLAEVAQRVHEVGAHLIVDGIQAAGYTPLDVETWNVDVYITGSYKWLCAPFGSAVAYISKNIYQSEKFKPAFVGWRTNKDMWDFNAVHIDYALTARKFEYGTSGYGVKFGFTESLKYLQKIGINSIADHNRNLVKILLTELHAINGVQIISPDVRGSIVSFKFKDFKVQEVGNLLRNLDRPVEMSIRQGMIRIALHFYNTESDVLSFVENLKQILKQL